jgi:hypothetical protein
VWVQVRAVGVWLGPIAVQSVGRFLEVDLSDGVLLPVEVEIEPALDTDG